MDRSDPEIVQSIKAQHADLARMYELHEPKIEKIWRNFDQTQRAKAFKAGFPEDAYLKHSRDRSLGNVWKIIPELNLHDIKTGPDFLLDLLKHRATTPLLYQYNEGVHGGPGDCQFIFESMHRNNLRHVQHFPLSHTLFYSMNNYGHSIKLTTAAHNHDFITGPAAPAIRAKAIVPQEYGEFVLERQIHTFCYMNVLIGDILELGSTSRSSKPRPQRPDETASSALSKLSLVHHTGKFSLEDMIKSALDQKIALNDYLSLCCSESVVLAHAVNIWYFTRPELIPDEKGRTFPVLGDKYIYISIFELVHDIATGVATWDYLHRLLQLLAERPDDKIAKSILLQEISNVVDLEFGRVQKVFKRYAAQDSSAKYFRRVSGKYDNGHARVFLKQDPELLTRENPQLSYIFRLCSPQTDATNAVPWITKLDDLHRLHPTERDNFHESLLDAFGDLAVIASFFQALSSTVALPPKNSRRGQIYATRLNNLLVELAPLKNELDLSKFAVPMDNLLEPGMTEGAIDALDQFTAERMGTKTGFLYQNLVEDCVSQVQIHYGKQKDRIAQIGKKPPKTFEDPTQEPLTPDVLIHQRKQKDKTRPADASPFNITLDTTDCIQPDVSELPPVFKVNRSTMQVFSTMFAKSESRGSVSWAAFESAMADLKFSVMPKFGSVFTFFPSEYMGATKSITFHRPHRSEIEGWKLITFASRLKKVYGWDEGSFEVV